MQGSCPSCHTVLDQIAAHIELDSRYHKPHCPLCGATLTVFASNRVFYDDESRNYRIWTDFAAQETILHEETRGLLVLRIHCKPFDIHDCFFDRLFVFRPENGPDNSDERHYSPLRPGREHLIHSCSFQLSSPNFRNYVVQTKSGFRTTVSRPSYIVGQLENRNSAEIFVWPNFLAPNWQRYYLAYHTPSLPMAVGSGSLHSVWTKTETPTQTRFEAIAGHSETGAQLAKVPHRIVLRWRLDGVEYFACWKTDVSENGTPHLRISNPVTVQDVNLGFDFGTTNTAAAVYYAIPEEQRQPTISLKIHDRTLRLLGGSVTADALWLPQPVEGKLLHQLPSQLMFESEELLKAPSVEFAAPHQFTIPYYQDDASGSRSIGQFKWASALGPLRTRAIIYRRLFLRLSLELFLAELVGSCGIDPCVVSLVATFPLAFRPEDIQLHDRSFYAMPDAIRDATGFDINLLPKLDESHAGQGSDTPPDPGKISLFIDVGGGTSDICLSRGERSEVLAVDSAEYGGEDLNEYVFSQNLTDHRPQQFRQMVRTSGGTIFGDLKAFGKNAERWQQVNAYRKKLQNGLVETAARFALAEAENQPEPSAQFKIFMLGLGWRTMYAEISTRDAIAGAFAQAVQLRISALSSAGLATKQATVVSEYPEDPKTVVARGAARSADPNHTPSRAPNSSFLLENVEAHAGGELRLRWVTRIPYSFDHKVNWLRASELNLFRFERESWKEQRLEDDCIFQGRIVHSPFRLYLSKYKKEPIHGT